MGPAFRRLLPFVLRYRRQFTLGLICVVITTSIQLLSPWILKYAIDDITRGITRQKLAAYAALLLGVACLGGLFRFLMRRILIALALPLSVASAAAHLAVMKAMKPGLTEREVQALFLYEFMKRGSERPSYAPLAQESWDRWLALEAENAELRERLVDWPKGAGAMPGR